MLVTTITNPVLFAHLPRMNKNHSINSSIITCSLLINFFDCRLQVSSPNVRPSQVDDDNTHQTTSNNDKSSSAENHPETQSIDNINTENNQSINQEYTKGSTSTGIESDNINTKNDNQDSLECTKTSTPRPCSFNNLDSYIQEHLNDSESITTVPCTVGSAIASNLLSLSNDDIKSDSDISTHEESLGKDFVFVNRDGTAVRSTDVSPRLSPTHPLLTSDNDDDGDAV